MSSGLSDIREHLNQAVDHAALAKEAADLESSNTCAAVGILHALIAIGEQLYAITSREALRTEASF